MQSTLSLTVDRRFAKSRMVTVSPSCLLVRIEQVSSHWMDFHEIRYLSVFETVSRKFRFD